MLVHPPHQDSETIDRLLSVATNDAGYRLGRIAARAEMDHVILDPEALEQIAASNDLNDATGYYAIWLMKRTEANGGVFKRDW